MGEDGAKTMVGTPYFLAPEVARGERYDKKCDVYGFAILLLEIVHEGRVERAFGGLSGLAAAKKVSEGWRLAPRVRNAGTHTHTVQPRAIPCSRHT